MENIKIEVGKSYILRNGLKTSPLKLVNNGTNYVFEAEVKEPEEEVNYVINWLKNGRFLNTNVDHRLDIII